MTSSSSIIRSLGIAALIAAVSAIAGVSLWQFTQARNPVYGPASGAALLVLPEPREIADFSLVDDHAQPFSLADLQGKWSLIFFGFTNCPDVCPGALYELQKVSKNMQQNLPAASDRLQTLFVSVDPERDTPAKLQQYLAHFDPGIIGITGAHEQLMPFARQLGIAYRTQAHDHDSQQYDVAHSASILLTDPRGRFYGVFPAPADAEKIAAELLGIIED